jgi:Nucleotidyl transferase of unknown function (DUF2204)
MDIFDDYFLELWRVLEKNGVRYILVGGFAINLHGYQRHTGDIDLYIDDTLENRKRLRKTFLELDMGDFESMERIQFVPGWVDFSLNNGVRLDIMTSLKGVNFSFNECLEMAPLAEIEGVMVPFLHINHLMLNKKAVNRPKDQVDVIYLEKIVEIQKNEGDKNQPAQ